MTEKEERILFEDALNQTGFGAYSLSMLVVSGVTIMSFACIYFNTSIIVPISACELNTTGAQQGMLVAGPTIGYILGAMFWGHLADIRGRKNILILSLLLGAVVNAVSSLSVNWLMMLILQFVASLMISGQYSLAMTILSESVPLAKRDLVMLLVSSIFLLSHGIIAVLAMPIAPLKFSYRVSYLNITWNSWRSLLMVYSLPSLFSALWLSFMQESPRFVFIKGDEKRVLEILKVIYRVNKGRSQAEFPVKGLLGPCNQCMEVVPRGSCFKSLFKPPLLKNTIIMSLFFILTQSSAFKVWLPTIAQHFMRVAQTNMDSQLTLCQVMNISLHNQTSGQISHGTATCGLDFGALLIVAVTAVTISVVNAIITLAVSYAGRRNMVMIVTAVAGASGVLVNLVPNAFVSAAFFIILQMGIVTLGLYTALTVALFPTYLRALALTFIMSGSRIANFSSVQVINYLLINDCEVAFYLYGSLIALSAVVAYFLPNDSPRNGMGHHRLQEEGADR